jgi:tyrosine-protein phosphatase YwqE
MGLFTNIFSKKSSQAPFDLGILGVDMHSHLIPGIDDGSRSMDETIALLAKFESLGYKKVITTPHIMNEVYPNNPENILAGLAQVKEAATKIGLSIEIEAAAEYYFDDQLMETIKNKTALTIAGEYVLVEFSFHSAPQFENQLFFEMQIANYKPILAHFERYPYYHNSLDKAIEFRNQGVNIQVNLNSLTGNYGPHVRKQAERLIDAGLVDFVGSDCHRMQHLMMLEEHLNLPYMNKLKHLSLKNRDL